MNVALFLECHPNWCIFFSPVICLLSDVRFLIVIHHRYLLQERQALIRVLASLRGNASKHFRQCRQRKDPKCFHPFLCNLRLNEKHPERLEKKGSPKSIRRKFAKSKVVAYLLKLLGEAPKTRRWLTKIFFRLLEHQEARSELTVELNLAVKFQSTIS